MSGRIGIYVPSGGHGGVQRVSIQLARSLAALSIPTTLIVGDNCPLEITEVDDLDIEYTSTRPTLRYVDTFRRIIQHRRLSHLIVAGHRSVLRAFFVGLTLKQRPLIYYSVHGRQAVGHRSFIRRRVEDAFIAVAYAVAKGVIFVSKEMHVDDQGPRGIVHSKSTCIYNPVISIDDIVSLEERGITRRKKVVCSVGRLEEPKDYHTLVDAFAGAARIDSELTLEIYGGGSLDGEIKQMVDHRGLQERVRICGETVDPLAVMASAEVLVLSSKSEGLPTVLIEALACGTAVVATDCRYGPKEILEGGQYGQLVPVGDVGAMSRAILSACSGPVDRDALKRRAADFSPEIAARKYLDLLGLSSADAGKEAGDR